MLTQCPVYSTLRCPCAFIFL